MQLPVVFIESLKDVSGFNKEAFEKVHEQSVPPTSIRINQTKFSIEKLREAYPDWQMEKVPWATFGYYIHERPSFITDPVFHAGGYYVQEASSMFLEQALQQTVDLSREIKVLDLCAAPGGKSTLIQSLILANSLLVSNEVIRSRVNILSENISKWGAANVVVTNNDPKDFARLDEFFDVIVVDAPCSGSGLFRKDADAVNEWSLQNVELCSQRQQRILADALPALKNDGVLIYSTCSYSEAEDESIADWLCEDDKFSSIQLAIDPSWNIIESVSAKHKAFGYRFYPDKLKGEGFFIAAFRKNNSASITNDFIPKDKKRNDKITTTEKSIIENYISTENLSFIKQQDDILALPNAVQQELTVLQSALYIKKAGVNIGNIIRNELLPHHELALSGLINDNINKTEVDKATALDYLRKHEIKIDSNKKGWSLITYKQLPLGWIKLLGNRINNYYPKEWRILHK